MYILYSRRVYVASILASTDQWTWCTYNKGEQEEEDGRLGCYHLPDDSLINSILCRLSMPYQFRCTCVRKAWRNLVHDAYALYSGTVMPNFGLGLLSCAISCISGIRITIPPHGHENNNNIKVIRCQYPQGLLYCDASNGFLLYYCASLIKGRRWSANQFHSHPALFLRASFSILRARY